jgi:hypothetical protein
MLNPIEVHGRSPNIFLKSYPTLTVGKNINLVRAAQSLTNNCPIGNNPTKITTT